MKQHKQYDELNLKFNGNLAFASNSFSKALAKFDKETRGVQPCWVIGEICYEETCDHCLGLDNYLEEFEAKEEMK